MPLSCPDKQHSRLLCFVGFLFLAFIIIIDVTSQYSNGGGPSRVTRHFWFISNAGVNRPRWSQWSLKREKQLTWSSIRCCQLFICTSEGIDFSSGYYCTFQPKYRNVVSWALLSWKLMRDTTVSVKCLFIYTWKLLTFLVTFLYCRNTCSTYSFKNWCVLLERGEETNWKNEFRATFMCARKLAVFWHNFILLMTR